MLTEWHKDKHISCRKLVQPGKLEVCSHYVVPIRFRRYNLLALIHFKQVFVDEKALLVLELTKALAANCNL